MSLHCFFAGWVAVVCLFFLFGFFFLEGAEILNYCSLLGRPAGIPWLVNQFLKFLKVFISLFFKQFNFPSPPCCPSSVSLPEVWTNTFLQAP